jgi:ribosomal protein S18 acetylase RimI-like enzyme
VSAEHVTDVSIVTVSLDDPEVDVVVAGMAEVLVDCVEGGASVGFMLPLSVERAVAFWRGMLDGAVRGERRVIAAIDGAGAVVGTVQVVLATPENQPHRGEISKMLVHRRARRRGVADALMRAAEQVARDAGRTLLVLDTASADAERLYARHGYERVGVIPDYALLPEGGLVDTVLFFKRLAG